MDKINQYDNICLIGPASVGKSFISNNLSSKTGLPVVSIDDIIFFVENEMQNRLAPNEKSIQNFKLRSLMFSNYNFLSPEMQQKQEEMLDEFIKKYISYNQLFNGLDTFYKPILEYKETSSKLTNPSTEFVILFMQRLHLTLLETAIKNINEPVIIDTPAPLGFKPSLSPEQDTVSSNGFTLSISNIRTRFDEILSKCGTKVFLTPGIDYKHRNADNSIYNKFLIDGLDNYMESADIVVSVNGMFTQPNDKSLKSRLWLDVENFTKTKELINKAEISNICDMILKYINELESSQMQ